MILFIVTNIYISVSVVVLVDIKLANTDNNTKPDTLSPRLISSTSYLCASCKTSRFDSRTSNPQKHHSTNTSRLNYEYFHFISLHSHSHFIPLLLFSSTCTRTCIECIDGCVIFHSLDSLECKFIFLSFFLDTLFMSLYFYVLT